MPGEAYERPQAKRKIPRVDPRVSAVLFSYRAPAHAGLLGTGAWLLFRDEAAFRRYMLFLAVTFFLSEAVWLLFPNGQDLRPAAMPRENPLTALVALLYRVDTNTNVFPSVHVVGSIGAALAVRDSQSAPAGCVRRTPAVLGRRPAHLPPLPRPAPAAEDGVNRERPI